MPKIQFTQRHNKLIKLKNDIDVLRLGQTNKEYIKEIEDLRTKVIEEIRKEQLKVGIVRFANSKNYPNSSI